MRKFVLVFGIAAVAACGKSSPAGTVVADWTYEDDAQPVPTPKSPPKIVTSNAEWPVDGKPPVKLRFEVEIGDLADDGVHWNWPRHVHVTLAEATSAKLPNVMCMPGPPGNTVDGGALVRPVGRDGKTPTGMVACFFTTAQPDSYVFEINGDGDVKRNQTKR
ncbi:MAG TPA: hypothetical protein VGH28_13690 [Polyangiaceae bacterium]